MMALNQRVSTSAATSCSALAPVTRTVSSRRVRTAVPKSNRRSARGVVVRASVEVEDEKLRAAEARWESQVRDGKVISISCKEVNGMMDDGWVLLDVRPPTETAKARLVGAVEVPMFTPDTAMDPGSLVNQALTFGTGGWWLGGSHMIPNPNFMAQVKAKVPLNSKVIVGCQKGLRSLGACEALARNGYTQLAWINGGLDTGRKGDLNVEGDVDVRYGGIGGLSEALGWTEVQQEEKKGFGGVEGVLKFAAVLVFLDGLLFAYEQISYMQRTGAL